MNKANSLYDEIMDEVDKFIKRNDDAPDFEKFWEKNVCPYCYHEEFAMVSKKIEIGRGYLYICSGCQKKWAVEVSKDTSTCRTIDLSHMSNKKYSN